MLTFLEKIAKIMNRELVVYDSIGLSTGNLWLLPAKNRKTRTLSRRVEPSLATVGAVPPVDAKNNIDSYTLLTVSNRTWKTLRNKRRDPEDSDIQQVFLNCLCLGQEQQFACRSWCFVIMLWSASADYVQCASVNRLM